MPYLVFVIFSFVGLLFIGLYAYERMAHFGPVAALPVFAVAVMTVAALTCGAAARRLGRKGIGLALAPALLVLAGMLAVEFHAGLQERLVMKRYGQDTCEPRVHVSRWPPFSNFDLACGDRGRWVAND
jgi:hypothetical protein